MNTPSRENYFMAQEGPMSIHQAVLRGHIRRAEDVDKVIINGVTMTAKIAVEAGFIDAKAAEYMAAQVGPNHHHTRIDHKSPEPEQQSTPQALIDALGAFLTQPTLSSKQKAVSALQIHLDASEGKQQ